MTSYENSSFGDGDLGSFDPIAAHLLDEISLAEGEAREEALATYNSYLANRGTSASEEA